MNKVNENEIRNQRIGFSITSSDLKILNQLAKKLRYSKTEIFIKALREYKLKTESAPQKELLENEK
jgi:hypothetical protein